MLLKIIVQATESATEKTNPIESENERSNLVNNNKVGMGILSLLYWYSSSLLSSIVFSL